jgi:hypothetical protein
MTLTDREREVIQWLRSFRPEQRSGEMVVRVRDGEAVQVEPRPVVKLGCNQDRRTAND